MPNNSLSNAAKEMAKRSVEIRKQKWGEEEFKNRMQQWGKLGGRPKGSASKKAKKGAE